MLRDAHGERMYRKVVVKVYFPDKIFPIKKFVQHAPAGKGFNQDGIDSLLDSITNQLDTLYPFWEFTLKELAPEGRTAHFLIDFAGYREVPAPNLPTTESTTPVSEAAGLEQNDVASAASGTGCLNCMTGE